MKGSIFSQIPCAKVIVTLAALSLAAASAPGQTLCVMTNGVKVQFPPNTDGGLDVLDSQKNIVLADDFPCTTAGPISDIHIWGSWLSNTHGTITNFWLGIYNDVPAVTNPASGQVTPSHPGTLVWQQSFSSLQFAETPGATGSESFYDPSIPEFTGTDTQAWFYCFYPTNPFVQQGTAANPTNYWLAAYAQVAGLPGAGPTGTYGWKTTLTPYGDAAVWGTNLASGLPAGNWQAMTNSQTGQPINLAFILTTPTNTPAICVDTGDKYVQWPNVNGGLDVWNDGPWVLADDFVCANPGPITDIHLWGSWLNDQVGTNSLTFWLAIYTNVPAGPASGFSQPGNLLWQEQFGPGQYIESYWSPSQENFLDPGPPNVLGPDSQVWYYCFYPTNIFVQQGSSAAPAIYWLMVYAQPPAGSTFQYGWKTTTNVMNDISVHAPWPGMTMTNIPGWTPTMQASTGGPLDLAFKITTATNQCIVPITCPVNKTVTCDSSWSFDPPVVGPDPCCTALPSIALTVITNSITLCSESYSGVWTVSDCTGTILGVCTQNVTVLPSGTNPPTIICPTNIVVTTCAPSAVVTWPLALMSNACPMHAFVFSTPPSGSVFPANSTNTVVVTAVAWCLYSNTCSFTVAVVQPTNGCPPLGCCPDTGGVKWVQWPDLVSGIDYNTTTYTLADDFKCTNSGPITDIHLWGSWVSDSVDYGATFTLAIWSDMPTNASNPFSQPGNILWHQVFLAGEYYICLYTNVAEPFNGYFVGDTSTNLYYLCFYPDPASAFPQTGTMNAPTNYWLSVTVQPSGAFSDQYFGWKSSTNVYNDTAVSSTAAFPPPAGTWSPVNPGSPVKTRVDLAFKITTATNPPPVFCVESDYEKYIQGPNTIGGLDVFNEPWVLADDFVCTNTGPIADIHLWGSWLSDQATNVITFWLGIYDDVPASNSPVGQTIPSHPGTNLLWQQWFAPGQYAQTIWTANASEEFLDPGSSNILGSDSVVWYYCFYPTNAFEQIGTPTNSRTYWLAAYAQLPAGTPYLYGWKTTTNVLNDVSVHAPWPGYVTNNLGWTPTAYQPATGGPAVPLDLAFKLTMCGPVKIRWLAPTNVVVTWPGAGYLQSATNVVGPYIDVPGAPTSPYTDYSVTPTNKFYRLRCY